jgi:hypothetical protein
MDPNDFSSRLVIFLSFCIIPLSKNLQKTTIKYYMSIALKIVICSSLVFMSGSRTALLTLFIGLMAFLALTNLKFSVKILIGILGMSVIMIFLFKTSYGDMIIERTLNSGFSDISSGRMGIWKNIVVYTLTNRPFFGFGLGKYVSSYINYFQSGTFSFDHNIIISAISMFGIWGSAIYIKFISYPFAGVIKSNQQSANLVFYIPAILAIFSGMFLVWAFEESMLIYIVFSIYAIKGIPRKACLAKE